MVLTNTSGAFGRIISEYTMGMILAQYKRLPEYYVNQKSKVWADCGPERSLLNKRVLKKGTPDEVLVSPEFYETFHLRMGKGGEQ